MTRFLSGAAQLGAWGVIGLLSVGCASSQTPAATSDSAPENAAKGAKGGDSLQASTSVISADEALSIEELLERGDRQLRRGKYEEAARTFERVTEHATKKENRLRGLHGWGSALDLGGQPKSALRIYSRYVSEAPEGDRKEAIAVRQVRLLVYLERWEEAGKASAKIKLGGRSPLEQLALLAARAHLELHEGRLDDAARSISKGRAIVDANSLDRVTVPPLDVASLFFALGELRAQRAEMIKFDPVPPDFARALEERCQLLLDAQSAYSEAMRSQDAHWSSMSGVKVGQLYKNLHTDLMAIPTPEAAVTKEKKQLFEGAMRLRYSILLRKSLAMMEATVDLLDRTHQKSRWRAKAREALEDIREAQKQEEAAIDALPYSRSQLQQVLDEMAAKAQKAAQEASKS